MNKPQYEVHIYLTERTYCEGCNRDYIKRSWKPIGSTHARTPHRYDTPREAWRMSTLGYLGCDINFGEGIQEIISPYGHLAKFKVIKIS